MFCPSSSHRRSLIDPMGMEMAKKVGGEVAEAVGFVFSVEFWRMGVLWTLSLVISYAKLMNPSGLFGPRREAYPRCSPPPMPSNHPVCIVTGATSGLGAEAALALSKEGYYVVLAGRSPLLLSKALLDIRQKNKDARLKAFQADLSSFQSTVEFVGSLKQWLLDSNMHHSVQLLINNAGILATSSQFAVDGHDRMMGTNYIGAFCLTKLLLPLLDNSPIPSRIVNVTSFTHRAVSNAQVDKETVAGKCFANSKKYPLAHIYEYSKFCLLLFTYELDRKTVLMGKSHQISINAADPGLVRTNIMRELPSSVSHVTFIALRLLGLLQLPENGINSILDAALAPPEISGFYFFGGKGRVISSSALSYSTRLAQKLWDTSCELFLNSSLATMDKHS